MHVESKDCLEPLDAGVGGVLGLRDERQAKQFMKDGQSVGNHEGLRGRKQVEGCLRVGNELKGLRKEVNGLRGAGKFDVGKLKNANQNRSELIGFVAGSI